MHLRPPALQFEQLKACRNLSAATDNGWELIYRALMGYHLYSSHEAVTRQD